MLTLHRTARLCNKRAGDDFSHFKTLMLQCQMSISVSVFLCREQMKRPGIMNDVSLSVGLPLVQIEISQQLLDRLS